MDTSSRPLRVIAAEIRREWRRPYFGAVPYLQAMAGLGSMHDVLGADTAEDIVRHFLVNSTTWRGQAARRVKAELRAMLAAARQVP